MLLILLTGCQLKIGGGKKNKNKEESAAPVLVTTVYRGEISSYLRLNGTLEAEKAISVFAETIGRVVELKVEEGRFVREGSLLARLDDDEQRLALERAQAIEEREVRAFEKADQLYKDKLLSEDTFESARIALQDAQLNLKQVQLALNQTRIHAPFSGVIAERFVNFGDRVDMSRPLFRLVDTSRLKIVGWVSESELRFLQPGVLVDVIVSAFPDADLKAELERISPVVDPNHGKIKVTFIVSKHSIPLKPGQFVEILLTLQTHDNAVLIPKKAVIYESGQSLVYEVRDSLACRRTIRIGIETSERVEILEGLKENDIIVIEGQSTLQDSSKINIVNSVETG